MAQQNPYSYLMDEEFEQWQPSIPETPETPAWEMPTYNDELSTGFNLMQPPIDATDQDSIDYWGGPGGEAAQPWAQAMLPLYQLMQNREHFDAEFGQSNERFWNTNEWSQSRDQFNMDLAVEQQNAQAQQAFWAQQNWEQQMAETMLNNDVARRVSLGELSLAEARQEIEQGQWALSFAAQQQNDQHARQLADQRLAMEEENADRQLDQAERAQIWQESYQQQLVDTRNREAEIAQEQARWATFGRGATPGRWISNF